MHQDMGEKTGSVLLSARCTILRPSMEERVEIKLDCKPLARHWGLRIEITELESVLVKVVGERHTLLLGSLITTGLDESPTLANGCDSLLSK
jgi:hypothetical protein